MVAHAGKVAAIVTAAGPGKRMGQRVPKQFIEILGKPLFIHTLEKFDACRIIAEVVLVVPPDALKGARTALDASGIRKVRRVVGGGKERQDSVRNGLDALDDAVRWVAVHDGVRPFVSVSKIEEVVSAAQDHGAAILALPVRDTVKRVGDEGVEETVEREALWAAQTPQVFRTDWLREGYRKARVDGFRGTDDASLVERLGHAVKIVEGEERNIKITSPEDLALAEWMAGERGK